ncbi:MAG: DUF362 domain-containing protein [Gemmatimonadetes bacterium]|nr:DUF362 domain-containing protein [Gemmatimonadota bacterium]
MHSDGHSRRQFLKHGLYGGAALLAAPSLASAGCGEAGLSVTPRRTGAAAARVALTAGNDRADMTFRALREFRTEIAAAIGNKTVVIKPNNVSTSIPLCATHADNLTGILEFLKSIGKDGNVMIAESCAGGSTLVGYDNYGYGPVAAKYGARLVDLDQMESEVVGCLDERDMRPHPTRVSSLLMDPNIYLISATKPKTHDTVVATLSLKNIVMAAPIKPGGRSEKRLVHGGGVWAINYNLANLAPRLHPDLAVIDGYEGMEGNGPVRGTKVDHRICVVSPDWLAADRVAIELMGIDFATVGYLNYCVQYGGMGEADLANIEILGPALAEHTIKYKLSDSSGTQQLWRQPIRGQTVGEP